MTTTTRYVFATTGLPRYLPSRTTRFSPHRSRQCACGHHAKGVSSYQNVQRSFLFLFLCRASPRVNERPSCPRRRRPMLPAAVGFTGRDRRGGRAPDDRHSVHVVWRSGCPTIGRRRLRAGSGPLPQTGGHPGRRRVCPPRGVHWCWQHHRGVVEGQRWRQWK